MEPARIVIPFSLRKLEHRVDVKLRPRVAAAAINAGVAADGPP